MSKLRLPERREEEFVWPPPEIKHSDEVKLRFLITLMYRAVFHNRALLIMATDSLGNLLRDYKPEMKLLAAVFDLCEIQAGGEPLLGIPPESEEIELAMAKLDVAVARIIQSLQPKEPAYSFETRNLGFQSERGSNFRSTAPARLSND